MQRFDTFRIYILLINTTKNKMRTTIFHLFIALLLFASVLSSCTKDKYEDLTPLIAGKWKLEAFSPTISPAVGGFQNYLDYSQYDIFYDFTENNVLVVSGIMDDIVDYRGHAKGKHSYKIITKGNKIGSGPLAILAYLEIKIDKETYKIHFVGEPSDFEMRPIYMRDEKNETLILTSIKDVNPRKIY